MGKEFSLVEHGGGKGNDDGNGRADDVGGSSTFDAVHFAIYVVISVVVGPPTIRVYWAVCLAVSNFLGVFYTCIGVDDGGNGAHEDEELKSVHLKM